MLLKHQWVKEEIRKCLETSNNENTTSKNYCGLKFVEACLVYQYVVNPRKYSIHTLKDCVFFYVFWM